MKTLSKLIGVFFLVFAPIGVSAQSPEAKGAFHTPGGDCVHLYSTGPDETATYVAGLSYNVLGATPALDPTRDEVPTSPMKAVRIAAEYLSENYPDVLREWELASVQLTKYGFPDGQERWYYAIEYFTPVRKVPHYRVGHLFIVVTSDGKLGLFGPKSKEE